MLCAFTLHTPHTHAHTYTQMYEQTQNTFYSSQAQSSEEKKKVGSHSAYAQPYMSAFTKQIIKS